MVVLYRIRDGQGERLELESTGRLVTWRVFPLGVHDPFVYARTELAKDFDDVDVVMARIEQEHREEGFGPRDYEEGVATLAPWVAWSSLTVETFVERYAWLGASIAKLAPRVREIRSQFRVLLEGNVELSFGLPRVYEPPRTGAEIELYAAFKRDPRDQASRSVYADWLEERGRIQRAEWIRRSKPGAVDREDDPDVLRAYWGRHAYMNAGVVDPDNADDDSVDLFMSKGQGPPEEPELDEIQVVQWVMSRGYERFWFLASDGTFRLYDLDGGVGDPLAGTLGDLWIEQVLDLH